MSDDESLAGDTPENGHDASQEIVDTVLDLDEALSGDVRRAERTARFSIEPWLQADLDRLEGELADLVDDQGRPLEKPIDAPMAGGRDLNAVMADYRKAQEKYVASMRSVVVTAMEPSAWDAFKSKWSKQLNQAEPTLSPEMRKELVTRCSIRPAIDAAAFGKLQDRYGELAMTRIAQAAYAACNHTGVDIPKSRVFSLVQRQQELASS